MKKKSVSKSASFRPRALIRFLPCSISVLLALLVFVAFPSSSALAAPKCDVVEFYYEYAGPTGIQVGMSSVTPTPYIIFYTTNGHDPTHTGSTPGRNTSIFTGDIPVPYLQWMHFRALAYKGSGSYVDSDVTYFDISNPVQ
jgi:chitobiase/beta-hexosaminidase-like protein